MVVGKVAARVGAVRVGVAEAEAEVAATEAGETAGVMVVGMVVVGMVVVGMVVDSQASFHEVYTTIPLRRSANPPETMRFGDNLTYRAYAWCREIQKLSHRASHLDR